MTAAKASKQIKCFVHLFGRQTLQNHPQFPFSDALLQKVIASGRETITFNVNNMSKRLTILYLLVSSFILVMSIIAKAWSMFKYSELYLKNNLVFGVVSDRCVYSFAMFLESGILMYALWVIIKKRPLWLSTLSMVWLGTLFLLYRLVLHFYSPAANCKCFGVESLLGGRYANHFDWLGKFGIIWMLAGIFIICFTRKDVAFYKPRHKPAPSLN